VISEESTVAVSRYVLFEYSGYPLVICYIAIENGPVEIVDLPFKKMVDLSIVFLNVYQAGYYLSLGLVIRHSTFDKHRPNLKGPVAWQPEEVQQNLTVAWPISMMKYAPGYSIQFQFTNLHSYNGPL